ncbi:baseplate J/gp47 family protein [Oligoflexus tunisiensis]|uniref:baseplate J/gp47 family protein n=1 Tax=Oligoflexus tunisiensis TaxID=708132 RepID=UPI001C403809|nr:baseplate J/gp47 family protein [Oligoflexus tunisiensis]
MADLPTIVTPISFDETFQKKLQSFTENYQKEVPEFKTPTPADPLYHILVEIALSELIGSERISQAGYAQLLKYSKDLEILFKSKLRPGETYEEFVERMVNSLSLVSTAGTVAQYKALTFLFGRVRYEEGKESKLARVRGAYVESAGEGQLLIHILTNTDRKDLNDKVLEALTETFYSEMVRPVLDRVTFQMANSIPVSIQGTIYLKPGYTNDYKATVEDTLRKRWNEELALGWQPTTSWIVKELHQLGVKSVILTNPVTDTIVPNKQYASIKMLELNYVEATSDRSRDS